MSDTRRGRRTGRRAVIGWSITAVVLAALAAATVFVGYPLLQQSIDRVADGETATEIGADASVVVPAGWHVAGGGNRVLVTTPDGVMTISLSAHDGDATSAFETAVVEAAGTAGPVRTETLASGAELVHADVGSRALAAGLASSPAASPSVAVTAGVTDGAQLADYRPALAQLLDAVTP